MKLMLFLMMCMMPLFLLSQEKDEAIDQLTGKLTNWQQMYPINKIYLNTDKEIYAPGEIIWFSGMILARSSNQYSGYYPDLVVSLFDAAGDLIVADKFPVSGGVITGDFLLPEQLSLGDYFLAAFTLYQEEPENLFVKPLVVNRFYQSDARVSLLFPEKVYTAGTKNVIEMKVTEISGIPADKFNLGVEIRHAGQKLEDGKIRSVNGKAEFQASIPAKTGKEPVELVVSHPKNLWKQRFFLKTSADELAVQFYPEGGHLVGEIPQKTGFYASSWTNTPVDLEADILSATGQLVSKVKSSHPGFGLFPFQPEAGGKYRFVVTSPYGKGQSFDIPVMEEAKPVLVVAQSDNDFLSVDLIVKSDIKQKLTVAITRGYQLLWAASPEISGKARIKIPTTELGTGIVQLTLFNSSQEAVSSRLVYLPENNPATLEISHVVTGDGKLKLTLTTKDEQGLPCPARLMVSVTDTMRNLPPTETLPGTYFLNGDLVHPADLSLFNPEEAARQSRAFDFLMVCNTLKGFSWEKVMQNKTTGTDKTPVIQTGWSGKVTDKKGNAIPFAQVKIMDNRDMKFYSTQADGNGNFRYEEYQPLQTSDITISATDKEGKGNLSIQANPTLVQKVSARIRGLNRMPFDPTLSVNALSAYLKSNPQLVAEPPSGKLQAANEVKPRMEHYKSLLASSSNLLDVIKSIKPYTLMNGQIVFSGMVNSINFQSGALIVIDGVKMGTSIDILNSLAPNDVDEIKISTDPMDIQRYTGLNNVGVIEILTKRGTMVAPSTANQVTKEELYKDGLRISRNFLTADALTGQSGKDLRTTIYWNPDLDTGNAGSVTFSVPLSEIKSGFVVTAEGLTVFGKIVRASRTVSIP